LAPTASWAQLVDYSQDFEALDPTPTPVGVPGSLAADGWNAYNNVFDSGGGFIYGYPSVLSQGGPQFAGVATGQGGPEQGDQQMTVYSDYNNPDHGVGNLIETNVFQEQTIATGDADKTCTFAWQQKKGGIQPPTTALAFIKVLDPNTGYGTSAFPSVDTTDLPVDWTGDEIQITIDPSWEPGGTGPLGHIFQFGFANTTTGYAPSDNVYDNVVFTCEGAQQVPASSTLSTIIFGLLLALAMAVAVAIVSRRGKVTTA
jgi:hypothetical protein